MKHLNYAIIWLVSRFDVTRHWWIRGMSYRIVGGNVIEFNRVAPINAAIGFVSNTNYEGEFRVSVDGADIPYA